MSEPRHCASPGCGKLMARRDGERKHSFRVRKTCGQTCASMVKLLTNVELRGGGSLCPVCKAAPREQYHSDKLRVTCGAPGCIEVVVNGKLVIELPWPRLTGEIDFGGGFGGRDVATRNYGRAGLPEPNRSGASSSAAWAVSAGEASK